MPNNVKREMPNNTQSSPDRSLQPPPSVASSNSNPSSRYTSSRDNGQAESSGQANRSPDNTPEPVDGTAKVGHLSVLRKRVRRSGGFLLDHALPQRRDGSIHSSKRRPDPGSLQLDGKGKAASVGGYDGGSLPANDKGKAPSSRLSTGSSVRASSPLSQEMRFNEETSTQSTDRASAEGLSEREGKRRDEPTPSQPTLDPTQLVQMALSLSEGRRRHEIGRAHV